MNDNAPSVTGQSIDAVQYVLNTLGMVFSTIVISGINIIVSGQLLGYVFGLVQEHIDEGKRTRFEIWFPWVLRLGITGRCVYAGFASFAIFILVTGFWLSTCAHSVFITNLGATNSQWTACQGLAAGLSVVSCIILAGLRRCYDYWKIYRTGRVVPMLSPEERVKRLVTNQILEE